MCRLVFVFVLCVIMQGNMGVPMLAVVLPYGILLLVPIVVLESFILKSRLSISYLDAINVTTVGNLITTFVGIPIVWIILVLMAIGLTSIPGLGYSTGNVVSLVTFTVITSPWVYPFEDKLHWTVPLASLILCIPFFYASYYVEYRYARSKYKAHFTDDEIKRAVYDSNVVSYTVIVCGLSVIVLLQYYYGGS